MSCPGVRIGEQVIEFLKVSEAPLVESDGSNIRWRDKPIIKEGECNSGPLCVVVVGDEMRDRDTPRSNTNWNLIFPVLVSVFVKDALKRLRYSEDRLETRHAIMSVLYNHYLLGDVTYPEGGVIGCEYNPNPEFNALGLPENIVVSNQLFLYKFSLTRAR